MGRNLFDIERPRKVSISIQGYDPALEIRKSEGRSNNIRNRIKKAEEAEIAATKLKNESALKKQASDLVALNQSLKVTGTKLDTPNDQLPPTDPENWFASETRPPASNDGSVQ